MAHNVSKTGFPEIPLTSGMKLRLEARSTTADADVSGVSATLWAIYGWQQTESSAELEVPPYSLELGAGG